MKGSSSYEKILQKGGRGHLIDIDRAASPVAQLPTTKILEGCIMVRDTAVGDILFGAPLEVVKRLSSLGLRIPNILVKPDAAPFRGIPQFSVEYPLYFHLFVRGNVTGASRLQVVCEEHDRPTIIEALRHCLLGPSAEEYRQYGVEPRVAEQLRKESLYFALKTDDGKALAIEDMLSFRTYDTAGRIQFEGGVSVERLGNNRFRVEDRRRGEAVVDLNFDVQEPPLPVYDPKKVDVVPTFGYRVLGCYSGFDPKGYTTGYLLYVNGIPVLVDGPAWLEEHLLNWGVSPDDIYAHIITHCHDDHAGCFASSVMQHRRIKLMTTREIAETLVVKLKGTIDGISEAEIRSYIDFHYVDAALDQPLEPLRFLGADWFFSYSVHSIPCIGFEVRVNEKSLFISGDSASLSRIRSMHEAGVLSDQRYEYVLRTLSASRTVCLIDGGGGEIHFDPHEFTPSREFYFGHVSSLALVTRGYQLLKAGDSRDLLPSERYTVETVQAINDALSQYQAEPNSPWKRILFAQGRLHVLPDNQAVILQGEEPDDVFFILKGKVRVYVDGEVRAEMGKGWLFGEQAVLAHTRRNATVITVSNTQLFAIPGKIFAEFVKTCKLAQIFDKMCDERATFLSVSELSELPAERQRALSQNATKRRFTSGSLIAQQGSTGNELFVIVRGQVRIVRAGRVIATVQQHQIVGEQALSNPSAVRNADIVADDEVELLAIAGDQFTRIVRDCPLAEYKLALLDRSRT